MTQEATVQEVEEELRARLGGMARRLAPDAICIENLRRLSGGASQETWSFDLRRPGGAEGLILRRQPLGANREAVSPGPEVEAAVMAAAAKAGVPVPVVRHVLAPADELGRGFVMARIEGETLPPRIMRDPVYAQARARFAAQAGEILSRIHAAAPAGLSLRESTSRGEVEHVWTAYEAAGVLRPVFEMAFRWLRANLPAPRPPVVVHGDFRNGNLMFGPEGVRAVLDWELVHLGDPVEDLAWVCVNSWRFGEIDQQAGGLGAREDMLAAYEAASGRRVAPPDMLFWEVLGSLRWGVMCLGMTAWMRNGTDPGVERGVIARRASEAEIDLMRLLLPVGGARA